MSARTHFQDRLTDEFVRGVLEHGDASVPWWRVLDAVHYWTLEDEAMMVPTISVEGWPIGEAELVVVPRRPVDVITDDIGGSDIRSVVLLQFLDHQPKPYQLLRWSDGRSPSGPAERGEWTLREYRHNVDRRVAADDPGHIVAWSAAPCDLRTAVEILCDQASIKIDELPASRTATYTQEPLVHDDDTEEVDDEHR